MNIELTGEYKKETKRGDDWGIRPKGQTIGVGSGNILILYIKMKTITIKLFNELYKQGYLPELIWDADERWGLKQW